MAQFKVLVIIDQLEIGGAGRVISLLLSGLVQRGYEVVIALDDENCKLFYSIPNGVRKISLPLKNTDRKGVKQFRLIRKTRRVIRQEKPDLILAVTFFPFFYAYFATIGMHVPVICYDHTSFGRDMGRFVNWIRYRLYGKADKLIILTKKDADLLGEKFPQKEVVYNPLTYPIVKNRIARNKTILCAGRLDAWDVKGFDRIIEIWGNISKKYPDWKLQIAGGGTESKIKEIKEMIAKADIVDSTDLLGHVSDMRSLYAQTAIFALPSRVEGFPMVLIEAMSQGCVCVSYEMGGAVYEIMRRNSGIIVDDGNQKGFSSSLEHLIKKFPDFYDRQVSGYEDASRFDCEIFYDHWDKIIQQTVSILK